MLSEAFEIVIRHDGNGDSSGSDSSTISDDAAGSKELKKLRRRWPNTQKVIQQTIKRRSTKQKKPVEVVAFELLLENRPHIKLLEEHRAFTLRGVCRYPMFNGPGAIQETFYELFALKRTKNNSNKSCLLENILSVRDLLQYTHDLSDGRQVVVSFLKPNTINDVLRLYYGARCVMAHGKATQTMVEGCLNNFPSRDELAASLSHEDVAEELRGMYERLKVLGGRATITYREICVVYRFFLRLSTALMVAIAMGVGQISKRPLLIWNYQSFVSFSGTFRRSVMQREEELEQWKSEVAMGRSTGVSSQPKHASKLLPWL